MKVSEYIFSIGEAYDDFIEEGFPPELSAVGAALSEEIDEIKNRLDKLENQV